MNAIQTAMQSVPPDPEMVDIDIASNPKVNKEILRQKIIHNIEMTDEELSKLLMESYGDILECIFEMNDLRYLDFVTSPRFINQLIYIVSKKHGDIKHSTKLYINKLVYDFITISDVNFVKDEYVSQLMVRLASEVNEILIRQLIGIGIPNEIACFIALARFSSLNEAVNIRRVNFIICTNLSKEYDMNDEFQRDKARTDVIEIYKRLFNRLTILFEATMFDVYNIEESWVTDNISEMYSITTMALLDILNNMTPGEIRIILMSYTADWANRYKPAGYGIRRSMQSLSADYNRIQMIVEGLQSENIYVP